MSNHFLVSDDVIECIITLKGYCCQDDYLDACGEHRIWDELAPDEQKQVHHNMKTFSESHGYVFRRDDGGCMVMDR